ncbi:MAG: hypothetical protein QOD46_1399 [Actinomycetota bacterium]|nr:hypothetical protein [Actinomycetota bacterium]
MRSELGTLDAHIFAGSPLHERSHAKTLQRPAPISMARAHVLCYVMLTNQAGHGYSGGVRTGQTSAGGGLQAPVASQPSRWEGSTLNAASRTQRRAP